MLYCVNLSADEGLRLTNMGHSAAGTYQCFVSNVAGTVSASATVLVTDRRQHPSDLMNIAPDSMYIVFIRVLKRPVFLLHLSLTVC